MAQSTATRATIFVLRELLGEILYFPIWWYTRGLALTARSLANKWYGLLNRLSIPILARTMNRPMYGDYTRSGRIISFFFRIILLVSRLVVFGFWTVILIIAFVAWLLGPIVAGGMFVRQIIPL